MFAMFGRVEELLTSLAAHWMWHLLAHLEGQNRVAKWERQLYFVFENDHTRFCFRRFAVV